MIRAVKHVRLLRDDGGGRSIGLAAAELDGPTDVLERDANLAGHRVTDRAYVSDDELAEVATGSVLASQCSSLMVRQAGRREELAAADFTLSVQEVADEELVRVVRLKLGNGQGGARGRDGPREEAGEELVWVDGEQVGLVVGEEGDKVQVAVRKAELLKAPSEGVDLFQREDVLLHLE